MTVHSDPDRILPAFYIRWEFQSNHHPVIFIRTTFSYKVCTDFYFELVFSLTLILYDNVYYESTSLHSLLATSMHPVAQVQPLVSGFLLNIITTCALFIMNV